MYSLPEMQSTASTIFSAYASLSATIMLFRSMAYDVIPPALLSYIMSFLHYFFTPLPTTVTIVVDELSGMTRNHVFDSAEIYLGTKLSPDARRFKVNKHPRHKTIHVSMEKNEVVNDSFDDIQLKWRFDSMGPDNNSNRSHQSQEKKFFELICKKKYKDKVMSEYLPFVIAKAKEIQENDRVVKLYTRDCPYNDDNTGYGEWGSVNLEHPSTFETLAMEPEMKKSIIDDLDRFVNRREFYKKVGKAWKRGYLLYGPPGTGKSSLIAAMANYLKFDIYDLELTSLYSNSELRRILISTTNRSIIVIEDIDCSIETLDREYGHETPIEANKLTLSGFLNFIDGLWSSCGDERIIVFTTNHKDKLDPALLRPGRMDMHIHMSYCSFNSFKDLAFNYLGINNHPTLFSKIKGLIDNVNISPAEIAEELLRNEEVDAALQGVVNLLLLKQKTAEDNQVDDEKCSSCGDKDVFHEERDLDGWGSSSDTKRLNSEKMVTRGFSGYRSGLRGRGFERGRGVRGGRGYRLRGGTRKV